MFLFFPFILPLKSYLLSSSCSRIANVRVVEESTPQEKRKRGTAPFVFFFKHPFPFFYLSILNYNRFNDTKKKKKKERYRNIVSFSLTFVFFFLSYLLFSFFYTLLHFYISSKQIFPSKKKSFFPPYGDVSTTAKEGQNEREREVERRDPSVFENLSSPLFLYKQVEEESRWRKDAQQSQPAISHTSPPLNEG